VLDELVAREQMLVLSLALLVAQVLPAPQLLQSSCVHDALLSGLSGQWCRRGPGG
jgi:hypothetical protein